jgi:hypothetical protein
VLRRTAERDRKPGAQGGKDETGGSRRGNLTVPE